MFQNQFFDVNTQKIINEIAIKVANKIVEIYIKRNFFQIDSVDSSDFRNSSNFNDVNDDDEKNINSQWNAIDLNYFDFKHEKLNIFADDVITQIDKNVYFKNVHLFLRRARNMIKFKKTDLIRENFWICFKKNVMN